MAKAWFKQWDGFNDGKWTDGIDTRDFIQNNYEPYECGDSFLTGPTKNTIALAKMITELAKKEIANGGVLSMDSRLSTIDGYEPGFIDKSLEKIVGVQTSKPFERAFMPRGGIKMAVQAAKQYNFKVDPNIVDIYTNHVKTHNQAVFDIYTDTMREIRHLHLLTGLPDAYARGRIIGDYRRIALYGVNYLIADRVKQKSLLDGPMDNEKMKVREEIQMQINALNKLINLGKTYGFDISQPAKNAQEAIQWTYFGYLAAVREQNGAAMSIGRNATFFDIYIKRDIDNGTLTEQQAQELMDHYVMKLRIIKFMRTNDYNDIFAGDPVWATESVGGMGLDGRTLVVKTAFRLLHSLNNMGPAPEPNLTVLWSNKLPNKFKEFCMNYSIKYSSIQYESDDLMRLDHGDDYAIACCVSPMKVGKEMQLFGARSNLAKALLYAINNGRDEIKAGHKIGPDLDDLDLTKPLDFDIVWTRYKTILKWLAGEYVNTLNVIHYSHDHYYYEALEMALHDVNVHRLFATGIAGLSVVADSLSAIKHAKVTPVVKDGVAVDFNVAGDFPKYGNDDDSVDQLAVDVVKCYVEELRKHKTYRDGELTMSILTITSNVMYGKNTGATPDGRKLSEPFAPGANPMHGRDCCGAIASLSSVAKIPYEFAADGISNTFSIAASAFGTNKFSVSRGDIFNLEEKTAYGKEHLSQAQNLVTLLDGYFKQGAQHLNVNVLNKDMLIDAQLHPEKYPQLTIRVSGYAVNFIKLSKQHQDEVIARTFHKVI